VTLILLRKERAIFGEEGREMEDPALLAPDLLGGESADGRVNGGRGGGRSPRGDAREPLQ
jgi:hypothetical protein